jgi:hypothetical protein
LEPFFFPFAAGIGHSLFSITAGGNGSGDFDAAGDVAAI